MTTILLIRHGETDWNIQGRCQGHVDIPLNQTGIDQAQALGRWLRSRVGFNLPTPQFVISSDLVRAKQTAQLAVEGLGSGEIQLDRNWREISFGAWEGLTWDEIKERFPALEQEYRQDPYSVRIPEAETQAEVLARAQQALTDVIKRYPDGTGIVVSHGGILRLLVSHLLGLEPLLSRRVRIFNCSTSVVRSAPGREPSVIGYNDHSYLPTRP